MALPLNSSSPRSKLTQTITLAALCAAIQVIGCSHRLPPQGALYERLNNRGPVLLSATNPYLPANRLLSEELDNSAELRDFVSQRGAPSAIQVAQGLFERTELTLIYPAEKEVYPLIKRRSGWAIGAPESLSDKALKQIEEELALGGMTLGDIVESKRYAIAVLPSSQVGGVTEIGGEALNAEDVGFANSDDPESARASLALDKTGRLPVKAATEGALAGEVSAPKKKSSNVSFSRSGTLIHTVTIPGETLSALSMWYTGDASHMYQIAKFNKISPKKGLYLGQSINIPAKLLKNKKPLTQAHLTRISR